MPLDNLSGGYPYGASSRNPFNYVKFEQINRDVTTAWLTLEEMTQQLNLFDDTSQDSYITTLGLATRFAIEDYLGLSIFATTYRVWYSPLGLVTSPVSLDLPEVSQNSNPALSGVTVNSVGYWNENSPSTFTTISSVNYSYDVSGNKIILSELPSDINTFMTAPIVVEYTTAANPIQTYPVVKQAALLLLTHLYNQRSNSTETQLKNIPFGVETLLRSYKPLVM